MKVSLLLALLVVLSSVCAFGLLRVPLLSAARATRLRSIGIARHQQQLSDNLFQGYGGGVVAPEKREQGEFVRSPTMLMYRFHPQYFNADLDDVLAEHKELCKCYPRLLEVEMMRAESSGGMNMLWMSLPEDADGDTEPILADVKEFVKRDPFLLKGMVAQWGVVDLDSAATCDEDPPPS